MDTISPLFIDNETSDTATEFPNALRMFLHTNVEFKVSTLAPHIIDLFQVTALAPEELLT